MSCEHAQGYSLLFVDWFKCKRVYIKMPMYTFKSSFFTLFHHHNSHSLSPLWDGWMICNFMSFSTVFESYQEDGQMIMKGCAQWNPVYSCEEYSPWVGLKLGTARSVGQCLTHWGTGALHLWDRLAWFTVKIDRFKINDIRVMRTLFLYLWSLLPQIWMILSLYKRKLA